MYAVDRTVQIECFEPGQNVTLWLRRLNTARQLHDWSDPVAIAESSMLLGDISLTWLINNCNGDTTWAQFELGMQERFSDTAQTILARIRHRKQQETESVKAYCDEALTMFSQISIPDAMKQDLLLENMKPSFRKQVIGTVPSNLEEVIANATFIEEKLVGTRATEQDLQRWDKQRKNNHDPQDRFDASMDRLCTAVANCMWLDGPDHDEVQYLDEDRPVQRQKHRCPTCNRSAKHCRRQRYPQAFGNEVHMCYNNRDTQQ